MFKTLLLGVAVFLSNPLSVLASPHVHVWTGEADWSYDTVCLDTPTNARLSPSFGDNIRATLVDTTCGNILYYADNNEPVVEGEFILIDFWFDELSEYRRYWIHRTQIETLHLR